MRPTRRNQIRGFTLVELLVVIVILSLLAGLAARAVFSAINTAKEATIKIEMTQILQQLSLIKDKYGAYPPSSAGSAAAFVQQMSRHVDAATAATEVAAFDADDKALTFWLGGVSRSPTNPMTGGGTKDFQFEFEADRLNGDGTYRPPGESLALGYKYTGSGDTATIEAAGLDDTWGTADDLRVPE